MTVEILLKGGLVLLACRAIAWSLGRRGAATRHVVTAVGLAAAAALPLVAWVLPSLRVPTPARVAVQRVEPPSPGIAPTAAESPRVVWEDPGPAPLTRASPDTRLPWGILYGSVTVALLGLSVAGRVRLRRLVADATEVPAGDPRRRVFEDLLTRRARWVGRRVLESAACPVPMALPGRVILPAASRGWPDARLRAVLLHEIAHLERGDALWRAR